LASKLTCNLILDSQTHERERERAIERTLTLAAATPPPSAGDGGLLPHAARTASPFLPPPISGIRLVSSGCATQLYIYIYIYSF